MKPSRHIRTGRMILSLLGLLCCQVDSRAQTGFSNGGAETGDTSSWHVTNVAAVENQDQSTGTVFPHEGDWFFTLAPRAASSSGMWQTNALDPNVTYLLLSGVVQTENLAGDDYGEAVLSVLDAAGHVMAATTNSPLTTSSFTWRTFELGIAVPDDASQWRIDLKGTLVFGSYVNVFYDDIHLEGMRHHPLLITNTWNTSSGHNALAWTSAGNGFHYTVEATDSLTKSEFTPASPTNQWPITNTSWTNAAPQPPVGVFRINGSR